MKFKKLALAGLTTTAVLGLASCGKKGFEDDGKTYTYNTYTMLTPSNWNELTYQDNNDTEIMNFIQSGFFRYDYKYDSKGNILPGEFEIKYDAATKLEDVTTEYVGNTKYNVPADAKDSFAYKITLREDLKWDDGTEITAEDFVYTMKQQLDPLFRNYRADSYYNGATVINDAQNYVKQGQSGWFNADGPYSTYSTDLDSKLIFSFAPSAENAQKEGLGAAQASFRDALGFPESFTAEMTAAYLAANYVTSKTAAELLALEGKTLAEIKADTALNSAWEAVIGFWQTEPNEELDFFITNYTYPEVSFDEVGIFAPSKYEIVVVLDSSLTLLKEDGSLSYKAAYNFGSLPLVKKDLYEANKHKPASGSTLWTTTYNQSVESTASWGPYKLTQYQAGKSYVLERNLNWYGYGKDVYEEGTYQTDKIVCEQVQDWNTAWLKFQAGEVDSISIDTSIAAEYKGSEQAIFTPSDFVGALQLQSSKDALKARETEGVNKTLLAQTDFRKALSLAINRAEYAAKVTTSSKAGFGLFNSMHYYDVENGGVYRNEDVAKQVLCNIYGVDASKFASLDEAANSITGFDLEQARKLVNQAVDAAISAGDYNGTDKVSIEFGTGAINEAVTRKFEFIENAWKELVKGTKLEGKLEVKLADKGTAWANDFRAGGYDVCMGGWSGAAWDPGYFLLAYLSPDYMYSAAWDTSSVMMEFTMKGVGKNGADITDTMSLMDWYDCLNGNEGCKYNWAVGQIEDAKRLTLIAALEEQILQVYYTVPIENIYTASLISYKWDYISRDYNTFMSYGGIRNIKYNYDDEAWAKVVADNNGKIDYKG